MVKRQVRVRRINDEEFEVGRFGLLFLLSVSVLSLTCGSCAQPMVNSDYTPRARSSFSFNEPSTFQRANEQQKATLQSIAENEFNMDHLAQEDQDLLNEALRYSGVEVQHACVIDQHTRANFGAFLGRWAHERNVRYHPTRGFKNLLESKGDEGEQNGWRKLFTDTADYPYPFSESEVLSKVVPIDLSSIQLLDRSNSRATYTGMPSRLLVASVAEDNIVEREDLNVEFIVNLETKRVTTLTLNLPEPVRVYRGISLRELRITYKFEDDAISDRNALVSMDQTMKGRIWLLFQPKLAVQSKLSYVECEEEAVKQSYLYESIEAIRALGQD